MKCPKCGNELDEDSIYEALSQFTLSLAQMYAHTRNVLLSEGNPENLMIQEAQIATKKFDRTILAILESAREATRPFGE